MVSKVSEVTDTIGDDQAIDEFSGNRGGRPTLYRNDYSEQAYRLYLLGATDKDLAEAFDVNKSTITDWKANYPEFSASIKKGKVIVDSRVAESMFKLATDDV